MCKYVFINSDASYIDQTNEGGFGIWIKTENGLIIKKAAKFKEKVYNSYEAELKAVINAVHIITNTIPHTDRLYIICDNLGVVNTINRRLNLNERYDPLYDMLFKMLARFPKVEARHVKGHQKKLNTAQAFINDWCDKMANVSVRYNITTNLVG